jgi:glucose/arabinose dehydrogenase
MIQETVMQRSPIPILAAALAVSLAAGLTPGGSALAETVVATIPGKAEVVEVASGLAHPWGIAFLPDGRALVTEREGRLRLMERGGRLSEPLKGLPKLAAAGQGGLLDVAIDPDFAQNRMVYLSFSEAGTGGAGTAVARGRLGEAGLENTELIYRQEPKVRGGNHFGSRLAFAPDRTLYVTQGDRFAYRKEAQNLDSLIGKVVRINRDGSIPAGNPFAQGGGRPEIWSYGHRNMQGAAIEPSTGRLWTHEHGARGGDEINRPDAGKNYGWPVISYGVDYSGARIGVGTRAPGMEQPVFYWDPSIAPSGMMFYTGDAFPDWKGSRLSAPSRPRCSSASPSRTGR